MATGNYETIQDGQVATIRCLPFGSGPMEPHWELASLLSGLQFDDSVRVVVLRGADDESFLAPAPAGPGRRGPVARSPEWMWRISTGIIRIHQLLATLDKPVVAAVTGDAIGIGCSLMFGADIIVAGEDVRIADVHMGMGETSPYHWTTGVVPGDGGVSLLPLFLGPALAKEFLMLARPFTGAELEQRGVINYAVPAAEVAGKVDGIVEGLLRRPAYALAWTKRVANHHIVEQLHRTLDAGIAYEMVNMYQYVAEDGDRFSLG